MVLFKVALLLCILTFCTAQKPGDIRLYRGSRTLERRWGIVQIYDSGNWTTLCSTNFGRTEALVICRFFSYLNGTSLPVSALGRLNNVTAYKSVLSTKGCETGQELEECEFESGLVCADVGVRYASVNCFNTEESDKDASVKFDDAEAADSGYFSTVLVYKHDMWGHICGQYWDDNDANVVCKQQGFLGGVASYSQSDWSVPRLLLETGCDGSEDDLFDCNNVDVECLTDKVADVICYKTEKPSLQLIGGKSHFGRVVLSLDGMKGLFCEAEPRWTYKEATVVCKTLGYTSGFIVTGIDKENITSPGITDVFIDGLACTGDEESIYQCDHSGWKNITGNCTDRNNVAAVYCYTSVRLATSYFEQDNVHMGRVELLDDGNWRPVCADTFSKTAADILCKELGFSQAEISLPGNFGQGYFTITPISSLSCTGAESSLINCTYTAGRCQTYNMHSAVICKQDNVPEFEVYTSSLSDDYHGDVIIERYGVKGRICRAGWDDQDASLLCRSLNIVTGFAYGTPVAYYRANPIWATNFTCGFGGDSLLSCGYQSNLATDWSCAQDFSVAGVLCYSGRPPEIKVGKNGGTRPDTFRAEVYWDNEWGTICDDGTWSNADALVYCRELGYPRGQVARNGYQQGKLNQLVYMSGLQCTGTETSILQCPNYGWQEVSEFLCRNHTRDAGVFCYSWVKTEPAQTFGAVLYHGDDNYGLVCAEGFDDNAALAVCREQSSFQYGKALCCSAAGPDNREFTLSNVSCTGNEKSLRECSYNDQNPQCSSGQYASVACADFQFGYSKLEANPVVTVTYMFQSGYVCTEGFTNSDAAVVCRQLGLSYSKKFKASATEFSNNVRWLRGFGCQGQETLITECNLENWGNIGICSWDSVAAVRCTDNPDELQFDIRLVNATNGGRVEIKIDNQWGRLCGNDLTKNEASVICRQLGYHNGVTLQPGFYGVGEGPVHLDGFQCEGNEESVEDCIWSGYKQVSSLCDDSTDAALRCSDNIQLSGSNTVNYGRLEVFDSTEDDWVAVCDSSLFKNEALQICRQLGYSDGLVQRGSPLGPTDVKIAITRVDCESSSKCVFTSGQCSTNRYAALYCSGSMIDNENFNIRLPLNSYYGPVSIRRYGLWGHICSVGFDNDDALVVCKQLGYQSGEALKTFQTTGVPIIQGNVDCDSGEASLAFCTRDPFVTDPGCYDVNTVAGVMCYNEPGLSLSSTTLDTQTGKMTTLAGLESNSGTLRIAYAGFTDLDAAVYCNYLGYAGGEVYRSNRGGYGVSSVECEGTEEYILQCPGTWDPSVNAGLEGDLAGVICYSSVRLVGGDPSFYGAVYTSKGVNSGPVCLNNGFDVNAASVTCKSLGYDSGIVLCCSPFGVLQDQAIITIQKCTGIEKQLTDCDHVDSIDGEFCRIQYASVVCYNSPKPDDYTIHLSGSTGYTGHVILSYLGINGTICRDGWNDASASVACKELGYRRGVAYNAERSSVSPGPFWTSNVQCTGNEARLTDCQLTTLGTVNECSSSNNQAGAICYDNEGLFYRLGGTDEFRYGRVELSINGEWRSICNLYWDNEDSHVLCKMLSYSTGEAYNGAVNTSLSGPVWEVNYQCNKSETDLNLCVSNGWRVSTQATCVQHKNDAGAFCYKSVKLSTGVGRETDQGAVLLYRDDRWYTICCDGFDDISASVVCRELGFKDGQALSCSSFGDLKEYYLIRTQKVGCLGDETDVKDCLVEHQCPDFQYASVVCYDFLNTTTELLPPEKKTMDYTPIIIAVVLFIILLVISIIVAICIIKWRRQKKIQKSKERFDNTIVSEHHDGSIIVRNRLSGVDETPEEPHVHYKRNGQDGSDEAEVINEHSGYSTLIPPEEYDNHGYSNLHDNQGAHETREPAVTNEPSPNRQPEMTSQVPGPFSQSALQARTGSGANKTVINVSGGSSALKFGNNVYTSDSEKAMKPEYNNTAVNRLSLSQQDEIQISKDELDGK